MTGSFQATQHLRRHPGDAGDREDSHTPGSAGARAATGASAGTGAAGRLSAVNHRRSSGLAPRVAVIACARGFRAEARRPCHRGKPANEHCAERVRPGSSAPGDHRRPQKPHSEPRPTRPTTPSSRKKGLRKNYPRAIKRRTRPMMGFKSFRSTFRIIAGIETMHMVKKGQLGCPDGLASSPADYFYSLAAA